MKGHLIHNMGSEGRALLAFWIEDYNSEMVQHLQFPLDFCLKNDIRKHITCLNLELDFRSFCSQSRTKKEKRLNFSELVILYGLVY